jgi:hypothetical protein
LVLKIEEGLRGAIWSLETWLRLCGIARRAYKAVD